MTPVIGLGVIIGFADGSNEKEVLSDDFFIRRTGDPSGWASTSPSDLEPGGIKMLWVYPKVITPLATYPDPTGLSVNIIAGDYPYAGTRKTFSGQSGYLLVEPVTGGHHYYAGLYLDSANALQVVYSASVVVATTPIEPTWPAGALRLSVVKIANGQTSINFNDDVLDRRMAWSDEQASSGNVWPKADQNLLGGVNYASVALLIAAMSSGDIGHLGERVSVEAVTLNKANVTLRGVGASVTIFEDIFSITATSSRVREISIDSSGSNARGFDIHVNGTAILEDCEASCFGTTTSRALDVSTPSAGATVTVIGGRYNGIGTLPFDIYADTDATIELRGPVLVNQTIGGPGDVTGYYYDDAGNLYFVNATIDGYAKGMLKVKNTSGATANANDAGYINEAGEYKTTTTANLDVAWCVVITGGANNADIYVTRRGRVTVNYTGTAPSAGHYLVTSTVAGSALRQTTMRPEIFAICTAAGSGGTVEALLLTGRVLRPATDTHYIYGINAASDSDFVATIATYDGVQTLTYNAPSSGNENAIAYWTALDLAFNAKLVLHNTTRGNSALISSVTVGTNTIVLTAGTASPPGWTVGDTITTRSQTNTQAWSGAAFFFDYDLSGWAAKPALAVAIEMDTSISDTSATVAALSGFHPYEAWVESKNTQRWSQAGAANVRLIAPVTKEIINNRLCIAWDATGSGTVTVYGTLAGWIVAVP